MSALLRSPLMVFLGVGLALFLYVRAFGSPLDRVGAAETEAAEAAEAARTIAVSRETLLDFVQLRTGEADAEVLAARWDALEEADRQVWQDRFVREEALVREARRLGLDRDDDLIRRRLVQQMEFLAAGDPIAEIADAELDDLYATHAEEHRVPRILSFAHVFVEDAEAVARGPKGEAHRRAVGLRDVLRREKVLFEFSGGRGDRFLYHRAYIDRTEDEVRAHFGPELAEALGALEIDGDLWQGPLASQHGWHIVLLIRNDPPRVPPIEEIRPLLVTEEQRRRLDAQREQGVRALLDGYRVEWVPADVSDAGIDPTAR